MGMIGTKASGKEEKTASFSRETDSAGCVRFIRGVMNSALFFYLFIESCKVLSDREKMAAALFCAAAIS